MSPLLTTGSLQDASHQELYRLAKHTSDLAQQHYCATHPHVSIRTSLAKNTSLHPDVQLLLAEDTGPVRSALAANPALTSVVMTRFLSFEPLLRALLARNPALPAPLQATLAEDSFANVKISLATNRSLTPNAQLTLASSPHAPLLLRTTLASHPRLSLKVQALLSFDPAIAHPLARSQAVRATNDMAVSFLAQYFPDFLARALSRVSEEDWHTLSASWSGSLRDLLHALRLLR